MCNLKIKRTTRANTYYSKTYAQLMFLKIKNKQQTLKLNTTTLLKNLIKE